MNVVLDASAAVALVTGSDPRRRLARLVTEADAVRAPDLFVAEVTNTFWKYHGLGGVELERCAEGLARALELPDELVAASTLSEEVFDLACRLGHPAYDLFYVVLARRHAAVLATTDKQLSSLCRRLKVRV